MAESYVYKVIHGYIISEHLGAGQMILALSLFAGGMFLDPENRSGDRLTARLIFLAAVTVILSYHFLANGPEWAEEEKKPPSPVSLVPV